MKKLTKSREDYLEAIFRLDEDSSGVRIVDIASKLGVSKPSVCESLNWLRDNGYIEYEKYHAVTLTDLGKIAATKTLKKHMILLEFFKDILKLSKAEAEDVSCQIEHILTDKVAIKMKEHIDYFKEKEIV